MNIRQGLHGRHFSQHLVPLSKQALEILGELKEMNGKREFLFPGIVHPRKHMSKGTVLVALKCMGYSRRMTGQKYLQQRKEIMQGYAFYLDKIFVDRIAKKYNRADKL